MIDLVKAKLKDQKLFLDLRNSKQSRFFSLNKKIISKNEHIGWFKKALRSKNHLLLKITYGKKNECGYVRFRKIKSKTFVSINIKKKYQNKKIGSYALLQSENFLRNKNDLFEKVKVSNNVSKKLFIKTGYQIFKKSGKIITMRKKISGLKIINEIEKIRGKNNKNWMDVLRLAYSKSPKEASLLISKIYKDDIKISKLVKKLI